MQNGGRREQHATLEGVRRGRPSEHRSCATCKKRRASSSSFVRSPCPAEHSNEWWLRAQHPLFRAWCEPSTSSTSATPSLIRASEPTMPKARTAPLESTRGTRQYGRGDVQLDHAERACDEKIFLCRVCRELEVKFADEPHCTAPSAPRFRPDRPGSQTKSALSSLALLRYLCGEQSLHQLRCQSLHPVRPLLPRPYNACPPSREPRRCRVTRATRPPRRGLPSTLRRPDSRLAIFAPKVNHFAL